MVLSNQWAYALDFTRDKKIQLMTKAAYEQMLQDIALYEFHSDEDMETRNWFIETARRNFWVDTFFGNLAGGADEEGVVYLYYNISDMGAGGRESILVYGFESGEAVQIGHIDGGNRAHGGVRAVQVENREIVVDRSTPNADDCEICYGGVLREWYRMHKGRIQLWKAQYIGDCVERENAQGKTTWEVMPIP
jgi:hypothetical protein